MIVIVLIFGTSAKATPSQKVTPQRDSATLLQNVFYAYFYVCLSGGQLKQAGQDLCNSADFERYQKNKPLMFNGRLGDSGRRISGD